MSGKKSTRIKKVGSSEDGSSTKASTSSSRIMSLVKLGGAVLAVFLAVSYYKRNQQSTVQDLTGADADTLKDVFFGDVPHLFYCSKGGNGETLPAPFEELNAAKGSSVSFAKVNCSQVLPSGKTVMQRFKIKKDIRPTVFATAPWMKPQQVSANQMKDTATLTKFIDNTMAPKPTQVFSDKDLRNFCAFGGKNVVKDKNKVTDTCLVVLRGAKYTKVHAELEKRLVQQYPKVRIAAVDAKKKRLSFEETGDYLPAEDFALKIHALRNRTHFLSMVNPVTWDYVDTFVSQTIGTPLYGFTGDVDSPVTLNKIKTEAEIQALKAKIAARVAARAARAASAAEAAAAAASGASTNAAAETDPAALEAERVRKERLRREQMERQAQEHLFDEADDADSEETNGAEGEEEGDEEEQDDEVVEL